MTAFFENWLLPLLQDHGLLIVFLTMTAESACILIPSEIVMPYGGFLAAQGHTQLWQVLLVTAAANLLGSYIAYAVGRYGGRALFIRYGKYVGVRVHHLEKAEDWFDRRGELAVFFTRMMPGVRTFISLPAGIVRMPVAKFLLYSFLGIVPWVSALVLLGYGAGKAAGEDPWGRLQEQFGKYNHVFYIVFGVAVAGLLGWAYWRRRRQRADRGGRSAQGVDEGVEETIAAVAGEPGAVAVAGRGLTAGEAGEVPATTEGVGADAGEASTGAPDS